jgi:hypothetical protein
MLPDGLLSSCFSFPLFFCGLPGAERPAPAGFYFSEVHTSACASDALRRLPSPTFASSALFGGGAEAEYGLGD